jgi:hypothetical protein
MDGGFFSLEAMTDGPVLQTVGPASPTAPEFNFERTANARGLAKKAAEDAPPGLTTAQINKLTDGDFEAHHLFPVQVFEGGEGSQNGELPRQLLHTARHFGFRK